MEEKIINVVPKWLNPYIKLEIINVDKYNIFEYQQQDDDDDDDVENENRSNQAIEDYTKQHLRVVLKKTKIYECKTCYLCYTTRDEYRMHVLKHAKPDVDSKFSYKKNDNPVKNIKCKHCDLRFAAESTLKAHSVVHHPFPDLFHCGTGFHNERELKGHKQVQSNTQENIWQTEYLETTCNTRKKQRSEFHIKSEYITTESNEINTNMEAFKPKSKLKEEQKESEQELKNKPINFPRPKCDIVEVNGKIKYVCPTCKKLYATYSILRQHFCIHTGEKFFECDICQKTFSQSSALKIHKLRHAGVQFECPVCNKKFNQKSSVALHMRAHTGVKPYDCDYCGKAFSDPSAFARHVRTHTGDKRYQCPTCPMRFSDASGLIQHKRRHTGVKNFKCEFCEKKFFTKFALSKHLLTHSGRYKYECHDCGKLFLSKSTIYTHITKAGVHSGFKCALCPRVLYSVAEKETHMQIHDSMKLADCECDLCGETFYSKASIAKHMRLDHLDTYEKYGNYVKKFKCEHCDLKFVAESTLKAHSVAHLPFPHVCHCGIGFHKECDLRGHKQLVHHEDEQVWQPKTAYAGKKPKSEFSIKSEHVVPDSDTVKTKLGMFKPKAKIKKQTRTKENSYGVKMPDVNCEEVEEDGKTKYVCPTCLNHYASYRGLQTHFLIHTNEKPFKCDVCPKSFSQSSTLLMHKRRHAGVKYECPVCKKKLGQNGALALHMRIHTGVKPYDCEFCGKAFSDPSAYGRHVRTHTGEKRYQCPTCPMRFSDASGLIQHKKRHDGIKNHKCEICEKKFYTKYDLVKHLTVHSKRYVYECHDCGKRFATKSSLYTHITNARVHTAFRCKLCPRTFFCKSVRERHMRAHQRLELSDSQCDLCGETFYSKSLIAKHLREDHIL